MVYKHLSNIIRSYFRIFLKIFLFQAVLHTAIGAEIAQIDKFSLNFSGEIIEGDFDRFVRLPVSNVKTIFLDSSGGDAEEALKIGNLIYRYKLNVVVTGYCLSSCANYLFIAGQNRLINGGLVGFHGNIVAMLEQDWPAILHTLKREGATEKAIKDAYTQIQKQADKERVFFSSLGIDQRLFSETQNSPEIGENGFYFPSIDKMKRFGILVDGTQNQKLISEVKGKHKID